MFETIRELEQQVRESRERAEADTLKVSSYAEPERTEFLHAIRQSLDLNDITRKRLVDMKARAFDICDERGLVPPADVSRRVQ